MEEIEDHWIGLRGLGLPREAHEVLCSGIIQEFLRRSQSAGQVHVHPVAALQEGDRPEHPLLSAEEAELLVRGDAVERHRVIGHETALGH